jgi:hypothetical protein
LSPELVRKYLVGFLYRSETGWRIRSAVSVGVVNRRLLAKRFSDVGQRGIAAQTQGGIVVFHGRAVSRRAVSKQQTGMVLSIASGAGGLAA